LRVTFKTHQLSLAVDLQHCFEESSVVIEEASCPIGDNYCMGICCSACNGKSIVSFDDPLRSYGRDFSSCELEEVQVIKPSIIWTGNNNIALGDDGIVTFFYTKDTSVIFFVNDEKVIFGIIFSCCDGNSIIVRNHFAYVFCGKEYSCCIAGDGPRKCQLVLSENERQTRDKKLLENRLKVKERRRRKSSMSVSAKESYSSIKRVLIQDNQVLSSPNVKSSTGINAKLPRATTDTIGSNSCGKEYSCCVAGDGPRKRRNSIFHFIYQLRHRLKKIHYDHLSLQERAEEFQNLKVVATKYRSYVRASICNNDVDEFADYLKIREVELKNIRCR
jgi:hypothetical protein